MRGRNKRRINGLYPDHEFRDCLEALADMHLKLT